MEFELSRCYAYVGKEVIEKYPIVEKYNIRMEDGLKGKLFITINSLEELIKLRDDLGQDLVIDTINNLVIYDDYLD